MKDWADRRDLTPEEVQQRRSDGRGHLAAESLGMAEVYNAAFDHPDCGICSDGHNRQRALFLLVRWWARDWCLESQDEAKDRIPEWCEAVAHELSQFLEYRWRNRYRKIAHRHPDWSPQLVVEACCEPTRHVDEYEKEGKTLLKAYGRDWYDMKEVESGDGTGEEAAAGQGESDGGDVQEPAAGRPAGDRGEGVVQPDHDGEAAEDHPGAAGVEPEGRPEGRVEDDHHPAVIEGRDR